MTYYLKYLKYKRKYLELKNMIGGREIDDYKVQQLYNIRKGVGKVHKVTYPELVKLNLKSYCWIGPPEKKDRDYKYGNGFFIYEISKQAINVNLPGFIKLGTYAIKMITKENIGDITDFDINKLPQKFFENAFKTTIELPEIPKGTAYDWSHDENAWIYNNGKKTTYVQVNVQPSPRLN